MHSNIQPDHKGPFGDGKADTSLGFCPTFTDLYWYKCPSRHFRSVVTCILIWRDGGRECFPWWGIEIASPCVQCIYKTTEGAWSSKSKAKRCLWTIWVAVQQVTERNTSTSHTVKYNGPSIYFNSKLSRYLKLLHWRWHGKAHKPTCQNPILSRHAPCLPSGENPKESYRNWRLLSCKTWDIQVANAQKIFVVQVYPQEYFHLLGTQLGDCWVEMSWSILLHVVHRIKASIKILPLQSLKEPTSGYHRLRWMKAGALFEKPEA